MWRVVTERTTERHCYHSFFTLSQKEVVPLASMVESSPRASLYVPSYYIIPMSHQHFIKSFRTYIRGTTVVVSLTTYIQQLMYHIYIPFHSSCIPPPIACIPSILLRWMYGSEPGPRSMFHAPVIMAWKWSFRACLQVCPPEDEPTAVCVTRLVMNDWTRNDWRLWDEYNQCLDS